MGEILGSKVPLRYIQHRVNSRRGIAGLSCILWLWLSTGDGFKIKDYLINLFLFYSFRYQNGINRQIDRSVQTRQTKNRLCTMT